MSTVVTPSQRQLTLAMIASGTTIAVISRQTYERGNNNRHATSISRWQPAQCEPYMCSCGDTSNVLALPEVHLDLLGDDSDTHVELAVVGGSV
jgi:hypothetical protein